jgi:hypothetical protein
MDSPYYRITLDTSLLTIKKPIKPSFLFPSLIFYQKMNSKVKYWQIDSTSSQFKKFIQNHPGFDLVLIDGNHEATACRNDFKTVKDKANIIVFHDIIDSYWPGVTQVWNEVKATYSDEYYFFEYTDQYKSVFKRLGTFFLGIGMAVKKIYLQEIGFTLKDPNQE